MSLAQRSDTGREWTERGWRDGRATGQIPCGTEYDLFKQAGLNVFLDGNEGQMHHKTMIIDERIVITGSYNFSRSAETRNDENLIVIYNEDIANFYMQEFQRVYQLAQR
jgi:phosphatidylserine/phosphatidylglycerophosphate/cardiolipin synthase-like enzyme